MRLLALAALVVAMCGPSEAGVLTCSFTEPFFTITYDSNTGVVTRISADETDPATGKPIPTIIGEDAKLVREDAWQDFQTYYLKAKGETVLTLQLTGLADDGMSDFIFPFVGKIGRYAGGCQTAKLPAYDLQQFHDEMAVQQ